MSQGVFMISIEQMAIVLDTLPDPAFILSRSGKYIAVFGGRDARYYHSSDGLVGLRITEIVENEKADWFLQQIELALDSGQLLIKEYEMKGLDINRESIDDPKHSFWFEGRIQKLGFLVDGEDVVLWVASNISERHELEIKLRTLSDTDQLTGLFNRRKLERDLALHYEAFERYAVPASILMFDLDNLKKINDTLGHFSGDEIIMTIGDICRSELRKTDIACRFGGDEFVICLPNMNLENAVTFANRLRKHFKLELNRFSTEDIPISISIGVVTMEPADRSFEETLRRADDALYEAKRSGKDQVRLG
jgi:two-component system, cell cycle response regulator